MKRLLGALGAIFVVALACKDSFIGPSPVSTTTTTAPAERPRVDADFSWDHYQGFTAFALGHPDQTEQDISGLFAEAMAHGWNTARVCAETEFWDGDPSYLVRKPRDLERLEWLLDTIARIPGAQVLLIGDCTLKGPVAENEKRGWSSNVAAIAATFRNVAIETHNEFDNCRGRGWGPHCPGKQDVAAHIAIYRAAGIRYITADDGFCKGPNVAKTYQFRLANIGAWPPDFHPCRGSNLSPWDPDQHFLSRVAAFNGTPFVLSETVAWGDVTGQCTGLRTCDQERINRYIADCAAVPGCRFTYHSEALLGGSSPGWWPEAR